MEVILKPTVINELKTIDFKYNEGAPSRQDFFLIITLTLAIQSILLKKT
jgi:hypothetical protein